MDEIANTTDAPSKIGEGKSIGYDMELDFKVATFFCVSFSWFVISGELLVLLLLGRTSVISLSGEEDSTTNKRL
jgi:hypothetical protein